MLKILQASLQQYMKHDILDLEKAEEPEIKLPTSVGSSRKQKSFRKTSTSALLTTPKPWLCGLQQTVENSERNGNTRPPYLPPEKSVCRSRNNRIARGTTDWFQIGKGVYCPNRERSILLGKAVYCHSAYLTYMQSVSCEMPGWMKHKLESRLLGEISITSDTQVTPPLWQKAKKN